MSIDAHKRYNSDMETLEIDAPVHSRPVSHKGTQVDGCECHDCEDTREFLRVSMEAMVAYGVQAVLVRCDDCEHWIVDGDPDNGRIGKRYMCADCFGKQDVIARGRMAELASDTRRGK